MLWLFNPPCPDASPTHPMFGGTIGPGIGIAQGAPPFLQIRTGPKLKEFVDWPNAIGEFRLQANYHQRDELTGRDLSSFSIALWDGQPLSPTNNREWAIWNSDPYGLEPGYSWHVGLRSFYVDITNGNNETSTYMLSMGWYCWYGVWSGSEPYMPPFYRGGTNQGWFDPLVGGRFERTGLNLSEIDGQPAYVDVFPFWP